MKSSSNNPDKKQKWYDDVRTQGDHNVKYLSKIKDMKEQLHKDGQSSTPSVGRGGDHGRHRTHPVTRPSLTRHLSLNLPVFVTNADLSTVPRAGRLSMYSKANRPVPAIHPVQGVGLLDDANTRKGTKRTEYYSKRHNSLTSIDKISPDIDKGPQPPTLKRFARSKKPTPLSNRVTKASSDEHCMHLRSYNVSCSHSQPLGRLRSRSTCSENESCAQTRTIKQAFGRHSSDKSDYRGAATKAKSSVKYKPTRSSSQDRSRRVSQELVPVKRSINVDVPHGDYYNPDASGYKAPVCTPHTVVSEKSDLGCHYSQSSDSGVSINRGSASSASSSQYQDTVDSNDWSEIGVTLSQIRLSHSQSEPSIKDMANIMAVASGIDADVEYQQNRSISSTTGSSQGSDDTIPVVQINSKSESENERQMDSLVTINAPFIMFRPATPRMPEREEKTYDHEVGRVLVTAASQAELRRKEMRKLVEDIEEFNSANKNLYRKVKPISG
ncbi:uncharacterized protein LOC129273580 [Lytechinus pictus]|uniref:uncharacterized protein LOC129273580 n=1 Tax=Lytechinus pictus TaxID=7653 RepID=UPI0030B9EFBE